jgi:hypothetical protein
MKHFVGVIALAALLVGSVPAGATVTLLDKDSWKVLMGGFAELDMINDSTRSLTEVPGNTGIARPGTPNGDNGRSQMSARNSRLAFSVLPPATEEWATKGYFEMDFLGYDPTPNAGNPSEAGFFDNPTFRIRHLYLQAEKNGWTILAGQYWNLFGWQPANVLDTVSVAGVVGELYSRNPQVRLTKTMSLTDLLGTQIAIAATRPVERDSSIPNGEAGIRFTYAGWKGAFTAASGDVTADPMSIGLSGTVRDLAHPSGTAGQETHVVGSALAVDAVIPILPVSDSKDVSNSLVFSGEFTTGKGYGDLFSSWSGGLSYLATPAAAGSPIPNLDAGLAGFDANGAYQLVDLQTFNVGLQYHLPWQLNTWVNVSYAQLSSDNVNSLTGSIAAGSFSYNRLELITANLYHDFTANVRAGVEYAHMTTTYSDGVQAKNDRIQVSTWFRL